VTKTYLQVSGAYDDISDNPEKPCPDDLSCAFGTSKKDALERTKPHLFIIDGASGFGGTWNRDRPYPNLLSQNSYGMYEYSDLPMTSAVGHDEDSPNRQSIAGCRSISIPCVEREMGFDKAHVFQLKG